MNAEYIVSLTALILSFLSHFSSHGYILPQSRLLGFKMVTPVFAVLKTVVQETKCRRFILYFTDICSPTSTTVKPATSSSTAAEWLSKLSSARQLWRTSIYPASGLWWATIVTTKLWSPSKPSFTGQYRCCLWWSSPNSAVWWLW